VARDWGDGVVYRVKRRGMMKLLSVSVGMGQEVTHAGRTVVTGIFKRPVNGRVGLRRLNLEGDRQVDRKAHGGIHKAVCVYSTEGYDHWRRVLGRDDLEVPQFGENFTVAGMEEHVVHVGDVFRVGNATVQVTQPRVPCHRLGIKMGDPKFPKLFLESCRVGFYLRVLEEGDVGADDDIQLVGKDPVQMSVRAICRLYYFEKENLEGCQKAIRIAALSPAWREGFLERLEKAGIAVEPGE
jgi:MOSC domain-containing protein YiiM